MGTNYYCRLPACGACGHADGPLHVGLSSGGWAFALHVVPERGINSLADWSEFWKRPGVRLLDEYDNPVSPDEMLDIVTRRGPVEVLARCEVDGERCIAHGPGSWDLIVGDFS